MYIGKNGCMGSSHYVHMSAKKEDGKVKLAYNIFADLLLARI